MLFVSHNIAAVRQLCTQAIYLQNGRLVRQGPTEEVLELYASARQRAAVTRCVNEFGLTFVDQAIIDADTGVRTERPLFGRDYILRTHIRVERPLTLAAIDLRCSTKPPPKSAPSARLKRALGQ